MLPKLFCANFDIRHVTTELIGSGNLGDHSGRSKRRAVRYPLSLRCGMVRCGIQFQTGAKVPVGAYPLGEVLRPRRGVSSIDFVVVAS